MPKCPECEYDLTGGEEVCPQCHAVLIDDESEDEEEDGGFVAIYATNEQEDADHIIGLLEEQEINVEMTEQEGGEGPDGELLTEYRILVDIAHVDEAEDIISDAIENDEVGDSGWFLSPVDDD